MISFDFNLASSTAKYFHISMLFGLWLNSKMTVIALLIFTVSRLVKGDPCIQEYSCVSCTEVRICHNTSSGFQELFRFPCPSTASYCNPSGVCSSLPPLGCGPTDSYPCMSDGVFPDPSDCQRYRVCHNGTSFVYECPSLHNYDSDHEGCASGANCYTISCSGKTGVKVSYENEAAIFAYCRDGIAVFVDRCRGAYKLNANTQTCEPQCQAAGDKIPDLDDCTKFFYCSKEPYASSFTVTNVQCPDDYGFDPRGLRCIPLKMLPACVPKTNTLGNQ